MQRWKSHHGIIKIFRASESSFKNHLFARNCCICIHGRSSKEHYGKSYFKRLPQAHFTHAAKDWDFMLWEETTQIFSHSTKAGLWAGASAALPSCQNTSPTANLKALCAGAQITLLSRCRWILSSPHCPCFYSKRSVTRWEPQLTTNTFLIPWTASAAKCQTNSFASKYWGLDWSSL